MATLENQTIASTYTLLLKMAATGVATDGTLRKIEDGDATTSALSISDVSIAVDATDRLYLDGGDNTYIYETAADIMDFIVGGVHLLRLNDAGSEVVINEGSATVDFRVEGNGNANLLFCDASADRVGIGLTSPDAMLHVQNPNNSTATGPDQNPGTVVIGCATADNGGILGQLMFGTNEGNNYKMASIEATAIGDPDDGDAGCELNIYVNPDGAHTLNTPNCLMTFRTAGHIYPGTNNSQTFGSDALEWKQLWSTETTVQSSDERLKENIQDLSGSGLEKINALIPRTFDWKKYRTKAENDIIDKGSAIGFIAQEVQSIIPELVSEGSGEYDFIDENGNILIPKGTKGLGVGMSGQVLTAYMVKAIQELSAEVNTLKNA